MNQLMAWCLAGILTLTGCVGIQEGEAPGAQDESLLRQASVATAIYPNYPKFVNFMEYLPQEDPETIGYEAYEKIYQDAWDRYEKDYQAYQDQLASLQKSKISDEFRGGIGKFAKVSLGKLMEEGTENKVYSPVNLYMALTILSEMTGGDTQKEVLGLLGAERADALRTECQTLWKQIYLDDGIGKRVMANSLWLREGFPFEEDFIQNLASDYYASTYRVPMGKEETDRAIQAWVNQQTGNTLTHEAKSIQTNATDTAMILLSTLYFYDQWTTPFDQSATAPDTFTKEDGKNLTCDFMHDNWMGSFLKTAEYTAATKNFERGGGMLFLLPQEGKSLSSLTGGNALDALFSGEINQTSRFGQITISVPKFDVTASLDWVDHLKALGVVKAFDEKGSDFTPLTKEPYIYVDKIQQASRVKIDEVGCTAASYVEMEVNAGTAMPLETCELTLDRPFLFVIFSEEQIPLFIGAVYDPS